jgi:Protein of unknown function (DUF3489)
LLSQAKEEKMAKLTDAQRIVLSKAAAREDGAAAVPANLTKAAAAKGGSSLVARKLMREVKAKPGMPAWREDKTGKSISLIITRAGRDAIGVDQIQKVDRPVSNNSKNDKSKNDKLVASQPAVVSPRAGTKQALIVEMLSKERGATLDALVEATGWLPHTTRAALTGLRKKGYVIERIGGEGKGASAYWVVPATKVAA